MKGANRQDSARTCAAFACALALLDSIALVRPAPAQQTILVERNVNLRHDASAARPPIRLLQPPEELELLDSVKVDNYYHVVRTESNDTGWVWANNVRLETATRAPDVAMLGATPETGIDPAWDKPALVSTTFTSPVRNRSCGPTGDGGDTATNRRKNRNDVPARYHAVTFSAITGLPYPATRAASRGQWPIESLAVIQGYEGSAVQVVGYLVALKPQTSGGESTNCQLTRSAEVDWHVAIAGHEGDGEEAAIVVEPTPRIRLHHPKWTVTNLRPWLDSPNSVRISGWLFFDPAHRSHLGRYRQTLWEIHPVTQIEVWQGGRWVDVDSLP